MLREDIDRIASEYFNDKESEHKMDEVFYLAKKALEEQKDDMLGKIKSEIESMDFDFGDYYDHTDEIIEMVCKVIDKVQKVRDKE